jgi:membrane protein YdbS with pleckstrin-like domain
MDKNDKEGKVVGSSGISLGLLLTIIFVILKLTHVVDWNWWWIFAPLWLPVVFVAIIFFMIVFLAMLTGDKDDR